MSAFKIDGDFSVASPTGAPRFSNPFPEISGVYVLEQDFMQQLSSFAPLAFNTAHHTYSDFKLVAESQLNDLGAGIVSWTRTYAKAPPSFDQFLTTNYNFIGFFGTFGINNTAVSGRDRFTKTVVARVHNEVFLVGAGETYTSPDLIPVIPAQSYYVGDPTQKTDYLGDDTILDTPSTPDRTTYEGWVSSGTEIVAEDSSIRQWLGNYYIRQTKYIKAQ